MDVDKLIEIAMDCYAAGYQDGEQDGEREATGAVPNAGRLLRREEKQRRRAKTAFVKLLAGVSDAG